MKRRKSNIKDAVENIRWFKKFSLEKRLKIAEIDQRVTQVLRSLSIKPYAKPGRTS